MLVSAAQVADTLRLLLPGFVLAKVFYQFGLRTKRTDAQWVLWGVLASAPIDAFVSIWLPDSPPAWVRLGLALGVAVAAGGVAAAIWNLLVRWWPSLSVSFSTRAWEQVLQRGRRWLQVETTDKRMLIGYAKFVAHSVDTDDLDLYLVSPSAVSNSDVVHMPNVEGILINRANIIRITVFREEPQVAAGTGPLDPP